ncbi:MAG: RraA family protein [Janthinobacterium lividum]
MTQPREPGWPAGFYIGTRDRVPSPELVDAYRNVPVPHASDCMGRSTGAMGLKAYHGSLTLGLCGPAITVRVRPGDNLFLHKAIEIAQPGDIIVVDGSGDLTQALIGGLMRTSALAKKIGGFVIDGAIRDVAEWAEGVIPVFARGNVHRGPSKEGPGELNVPIACAGLTVSPGDLILGDADGVVAIPYDQIETLLPLVRAHAAKEEKIRANNQSGTSDPERFNSILRGKGCPV